jgi:hypothetical protein
VLAAVDLAPAGTDASALRAAAAAGAPTTPRGKAVECCGAAMRACGDRNSQTMTTTTTASATSTPTERIREAISRLQDESNPHTATMTPTSAVTTSSSVVPSVSKLTFDDARETPRCATSVCDHSLRSWFRYACGARACGRHPCANQSSSIITRDCLVLMCARARPRSNPSKMRRRVRRKRRRRRQARHPSRRSWRD